MSAFPVPHLGCVVHGSSGNDGALRVEAEADNLCLVAFQRVVQLRGVGQVSTR